MKGHTEVDVGESESYGFSDAILPAVRWSHYQLAGGVGIGLLDRALTGHELNGRTVTLGLINSHGCYAGLPNELLAGQGHHHFAYALLPHKGTLAEAKIPRAAWEFNAPVFGYIGARSGIRETYLRTSENVIVEAMRRDAQQIEVRLYEWMGVASKADVHLELPHGQASLTNLMGEHPSPLRGGPAYRFAIRPQEIVTVRFAVDSSVARPELIRDWAPLVPANKRKDLERRIGAKGHPPAPWLDQ